MKLGVRFRRSLLAAALLLVALVSLGAWRLFAAGPAPQFVEYRMSEEHDMPTAIAAAPDGAIWFTIDLADAIGHLQAGRIDRLSTAVSNVEPLGLAAADDGSAWFTDNAAHAISHITAAGELTHVPLDTGSVRLGRLALASDGAVWFAEETAFSITRLKDGVLTRHVFDQITGGPYGVAVATDGTVWATLRNTDQLLRINPDGKIATIDLPNRGASPSDIAVAPDGSVWFTEFRANRLGRYKDGRIEEIHLGEGPFGLTGLVVASDGTVWFGMLRTGRIGRFAHGKFTSFALPHPHARPCSLALDGQGHLWYADITGYIGKLEPPRD